jgi:hypothetical protein
MEKISNLLSRSGSKGRGNFREYSSSAHHSADLPALPHYSLCVYLRAKDVASFLFLRSNQPMGLLEFPSRSRGAISEEERGCHCSTCTCFDCLGLLTASAAFSFHAWPPICFQSPEEHPIDEELFFLLAALLPSHGPSNPSSSTTFYLTHPLDWIRWRDRDRASPKILNKSLSFHIACAVCPLRALRPRPLAS